MTSHLTLRLIPDTLSVCRLAPDAAMPWWATVAPFFSVTRTADELSIICASSRVPPGTEASHDWRALKLHGQFDHGLTGILESISTPLAKAGISMLVVATFDTHYVLLQEPHLAAATAALHAVGHRVLREQRGAPVGP